MRLRPGFVALAFAAAACAPDVSVDRSGPPGPGIEAGETATDDPDVLATSRPELVLKPARASIPSEEDVSALIRHIASLEPASRHRAYQALLERGERGYDEVFLVGLNEDDIRSLEVVVAYFRDHHPDRAIEPLIDLLMYVQGDRDMRDRIVEALQGFGAAVIAPVVSRLENEPASHLAGGARQGLEEVLAGAVDGCGKEVLDRFLDRARPEWLLAYAKVGAARKAVPPVDAETFRVLARRLERDSDARAVEGALRIVARLARRPDLPRTVSRVVPAVARHLDGASRRWALYALAMVADARVSRKCADLAARSPRDRFWALQVLATTGDSRRMGALVRALDDPAADIRAEAAFLVSLDLVPGAAPALRRLLRDGDGAADRSAVAALGRLRDPGARPILEALLERSSLEVQADILRALLARGDAELAASLQGWMDITLLAPARVGTVSLEARPGRDAFLYALLHVAVDGGEGGRAYLSRLAGELGGEAGRMAAAVLELSRWLGQGLGTTLERVVLGETIGREEAGVQWRGRELPLGARESLFLLCPRRADARTREVLEAILLRAPGYRDRLLAAEALYALEDPASIPALRRALGDPYFRDGPYPLYRFPVRRAAARGLEKLGVRVSRHADRTYSAYSP